jgi:F0F1-type ATP synthase epsilon subunit
VESVEAPGKDGYLGILPGHAALAGQLGTGFLSYARAGPAGISPSPEASSKYCKTK